MRFERDRDGLRRTLPGSRDNLAEYPKVCAMHPIKIPHANQRGPEASRNILDFMKKLHAISQQRLTIWGRAPSPVRGRRPASDLKVQLHPVIRQLYALRQCGIG